jgi:hypothetical protein
MFSMICVIWLAVGGSAQPLNEAQTPSLEVKRTVNALVGQWRFEGSDAEPGVKEPVKVTMAFDCRLAALGAAVACTLSGNVANSGPIEAASIVGYDSDEQIVHWMEISSTGEYHDHRGKWKGEMIAFEPLQSKAIVTFTGSLTPGSASLPSNLHCPTNAFTVLFTSSEGV